ncbi:hypothetical protein PYCCODRAFT_1205437 [Trametes coccinea BRFM310]|uniref:Uncharacterized protein n=1 Tax=Trametes coccinea (strain BRFM310) TaxID=1353009 RepID=A0A1Y2I751_TRAC3|nr:hypothetical protein PYCCODRAFT_1205437 [Trametes coccinea BRFM310]
MSRLQRQNTLGICTVTPSSSQPSTLNRPSPYPLHSSIANASVATTSNAVPATANAVPSSSFSHPESSSSLLSSADEEAPFASRPSDARVPVQDLGVKPNVLPREMGTLKRADLEVADTGTIKRIAQIVAVPSNLPREQMLEQIFAGRDVIPIPRKHRSLRVAATEKGIVVRTGIDKGLARPALKAIKGYNPHKEDIVAMARKEMGPQSPVPTEVGSPPPNPADLSLPEDRPTCILNKGKSVDRSVNGGDSVAASPYGRPTRVPLGRLVPADFSRPPIPTPMDSGSDYESEDDEMYPFEEVRAVEEMHAFEEVREVEEDPSRDQDTGVEYTYPPSNPESREWLEEMGSQIQSDAKELFDKASGARNEITNIVAIGILVDHDLNAVEKMYRQLSQHITRVAGPRLMRRIKERAAEIELPPFEEDSYVDENRPQAVPTGHPGQYVYDPAAGAHAQE